MGWYYPNFLDSLQHVTYTQVFLYSFLWQLGVAQIIIVSLFIAVFLIRHFIAKKFRKDQVNQTQRQILGQQNHRESRQLGINLNEDEEQREAQQENRQEQIIEKRLSQKHTNSAKSVSNTLPFLIVDSLRGILFYSFLVSLSCMYLIFYAYGYLGGGFWGRVLACGATFNIVFIPTFLWRGIYLKQKFTLPFLLATLFLFTACILLPGAVQNTCMCIFNDNYGFEMQNVFKFSTAFTRTFQIESKICGDIQICHLYTTLPQNTSSSVFINVHTGKSINELIFQLRNVKTDQIFIQDTMLIYKLDQNEPLFQRNIHSVLFENLNSSTTYELTIKNQTHVLKTSNYRTPPNQKAQQLKLAIGGDLGLTKNGSLITSHLNNFDPDVILIGGDVAYDDGMRSCWYSWDNFYWIFQSLELTLNRTIPMIFSVGNHDIGFDAFTTVNMSRDVDEIPFFFFFNPQHLSRKPGKKIPDVDQRMSYHYHKIGNTVHLILDSGYDQSYEAQVPFIKDVSEKHPSFYKFANYHNPIYPSCNFSIPQKNGVNVISNGTFYWTPLFDKYNFITAMEHHNHHRKITKKLFNGASSKQKGTRYIGDGSWGVQSPECGQNYVTKYPQLFEQFDHASPNHIWQITIKNVEGKSTINYTAIDLQGTLEYQLIQQLPVLQ